MGRKRSKAPTYRPPVKGALERAVDVMMVWHGWQDQSYPYAYWRVAAPLLDMPAKDWRFDPPDRRLRELDDIPEPSAFRWIDRVRRRHLLASILFTDILHVMSVVAQAIGDRDRGDTFPSTTMKRELSMRQGHYFIEFQVPPGAAFRYQNEVNEDFLPGFRGVAKVERCHLSSSWNEPHGHGCGIVPGLGRCEALLGFDLPCVLFRHASLESGQVRCEPGKEPIQAAVHVPFRFIIGCRESDHWHTHIGPLVPALPLGEMTELISQAVQDGGQANGA